MPAPSQTHHDARLGRWFASAWRVLAGLPGASLLARSGLTKRVRAWRHRGTLARGVMHGEVRGCPLSIKIKTIEEIARFESAWREDWLFDGMRQAIKEGNTVWDVGANIGIVSLWLASSDISNLQIVSFEPAPDNADALRSNLALNGFTSVTVREEALGSEPGHAILVLAGPRGDGRNRLTEVSDDQVGVEVKVLTGDMVAKELGGVPDVVKIDVEGAEHAVLAGMADMLAQGKPSHLFVELHPSLLMRSDSSETAVKQYVEGLNYRIVSTHSRGSETQLHAIYAGR